MIVLCFTSIPLTPNLIGLIAGDHNEPETVSFLRFLASQNSLSLIDIGGCLGEIAIPVSTVESITKVYVFEPLPELCSIISVNIALNNLSSKVSLHPLAVSSTNGKVDMLIPKVATGTVVTSENCSFPPTPLHDNVVTVDSTTLDSFFDNSVIDGCLVILVDVEGHELSVIKGASRLIAQCQPFVIFEYNHVSKQSFTIDQMIALMGPSYSFYRLRSDGFLDFDIEEAWNCVAVPEILKATVFPMLLYPPS